MAIGFDASRWVHSCYDAAYGDQVHLRVVAREWSLLSAGRGVPSIKIKTVHMFWNSVGVWFILTNSIQKEVVIKLGISRI